MPQTYYIVKTVTTSSSHRYKYTLENIAGDDQRNDDDCIAKNLAFEVNFIVLHFIIEEIEKLYDSAFFKLELLCSISNDGKLAA